MKENVTEELYQIQLADAAIEVGGDVLITFGDAEIKLPLELMEEFKEKGMRSDILACILTSYITYGGMQPEEAVAFVKDGFAKGFLPQVAFVAPDGGALKLTTPEAAPTFNKIVEAMQG